MLPRLEAGEQLQAIDAVAAGTGAMKDPRPYLRELRKLAQANVKARKATPADLAGMGISVERG